MTRIACLAAAMALATTNGATAAGRHEHSHSSSGASHYHHSSTTAPAVFHPPAVFPVVAGYAPYYSSYSSRQPLTFPRAVTPGLIYLPASSPNAPPFSFNGSEELPGWNWQRVSLQQIDAEVRAKRAANPSTSPTYRRYCPDSRAYYPDVTRCESEWLTVLSKAPSASPVVATR